MDENRQIVIDETNVDESQEEEEEELGNQHKRNNETK